MDKEKIISRLNIKDYNNQLEKILASKDFSEDTKNLLLSMLYNIENAYKDYKTVKASAEPKKDILQKILNLVEFNCNNFTIVEPSEKDKIMADRVSGKIITYLNTKKVLYLLFLLQNIKIKVNDKYKILEEPLRRLILEGNAMNYSEIIRDFDGWAWNINVKEIENIDYNFAYQIITTLLGFEFWSTIENNDFIKILSEQLKLKYDLDMADEILILILQISVLTYLKDSPKEINNFKKIKVVLEEKSLKMSDKETFLDNLIEEKKKIDRKIIVIDKMINDDKLLKKEFIKRNEKLDLNHRIFSISDLEEILQKEKLELKIKKDKLTQEMKPINYLKEKEELDKSITILNSLTVNIEELKINLIKITLKALILQAKNEINRENIAILIYTLRYLENMYITNKVQIKNVKELKNRIELAEKAIITRACELKSINIISRKIETNYKIISKILKTNIINFDNIYIKFEKENNKIVIKVYDEINNFEDLEYDDIEELNIKFNKKIKLFL